MDGPSSEELEPATDPWGPRAIDPGHTLSDKIFRGTSRGIGIFVLVLTGSIGVFLGLKMIPTLNRYGWSFLFSSEWSLNRDQLGIAAVLVGTIEVALIALIVGFPLALLTALFISEYAPPRFKSFFVAMIDLMAAVPSIIYGLWGFFLLQPHAIYFSRWLSQNLGWIPIFHVNTDPDAAAWEQSQYIGSAFVVGLCVSLMIIPLSCAVMRGVFSLAPIGEREAAYALGSTKWGMVRTVVLPFGRGGIIGGTMLGLGRALGETVAVLLIFTPTYDIKYKILSKGTNTTSALIAGNFGETTGPQLYALLAAGFVLFVMTLGVNTVAAVFVGRSRSGSDI